MDDHLDGVSPVVNDNNSSSPGVLSDEIVRSPLHDKSANKGRMNTRSDKKIDNSVNVDVLKQKLQIRDSKLDTVIQISQCFYEELQRVTREADLLKQRSNSLYRRQAENSDNNSQLENLAQRQNQQLILMQKEIIAGKQRDIDNQQRIEELLKSNMEWEEALK